MKKITAIALALVMVVAFSAVAFADGPMGNGPQGGPGMKGNAPGMGGMNGFDPINAIFDAVNALEDETVRANIESLMQAEFDAIVAEREAEDKDAAAAAVTAAREALQAALAEAGIEFTMPEMGGQQPPEIPNK